MGHSDTTKKGGVTIPCPEFTVLEVIQGKRAVCPVAPWTSIHGDISPLRITVGTEWDALVSASSLADLDPSLWVPGGSVKWSPGLARSCK